MTLRVGLVGANGNFGTKRFKAINASNDKVVAICDIDFSNIKKVINDKTACVNNYSALVDYNLDAVVISTPDYLKKELIMYFLSEGIHVLVEKPLSVDPNDINEFYKLAVLNKCVLYTGYNIRFFPSVKKLINLLDDNYFGEIRHVRMFYGHGGIHSLLAKDNWRTSSKSWGGSFIDMGTHLLNLCNLFINEMGINIDIYKQFIIKNGVEDHCTVIIKNDRTIIELTSSWASWRSQFSLDVYGDEGFCRINSLVKYMKYGQNGENLVYGKKNIKGAPDVTQLRWVNIETLNTDEFMVDPLLIDTEFLGKDWLNFKKQILDYSKYNFNNKNSDVFIARILKKYSK